MVSITSSTVSFLTSSICCGDPAWSCTMPKMEPMHNRNRSLLLYVYSLPRAKAANRMMLLFKKVSARRGVNHFFTSTTHQRQVQPLLWESCMVVRLLQANFISLAQKTAQWIFEESWYLEKYYYIVFLNKIYYKHFLQTNVSSAKNAKVI